MAARVAELAGRVALVTGGGKGLGKVIARTLGLAGAQLFIVGRGEENLTNTCDVLRAEGRRVETLAIDLKERDAAQRAVGACVAKLGRLDIVVNCAGVFVWRKFLDLSDEDWDRTLETNLSVPFRLTQAAARVFQTQGHGGAVVNIASIHGTIADPNVVPQVAAKAGLLGLTRAAAEALRPLGVRVNAVSPGAIQPDSGEALSADLTHKITQADVAEAVLFLVGDKARGITGTVLEASGITRAVIASG